MLQEIHLAHTQGFCAGVSSAIDIVELCLKKYGTPLYVRHAIVHNTSIIKDFETRGVVFIEELKDVPDDRVVIFSAHGTAPDVFEKAKLRGLHIIDATCPLVTKVHRQARRYSQRMIPTILIGHRGHQELIGTSGYVDQDLLYVVEDLNDVEGLELSEDQEIAVLTQTTLSVTDTSHLIGRLKERFPKLITGSKEDICYATQNRQDAVKELTTFCDLIVICGSPDSSNSNRLRETAEAEGVESHIIDLADEFDLSLLKGKKILGVSSGASVPAFIVDELVRKVQHIYPKAKVVQKESIEKGIEFPLPEELETFKSTI